MYSTKLTVRPIGNCDEAPKYLGVSEFQGRQRVIPVAFFPSRLPCSFHIIIPKGFVGLVNRNGKYVGIWGPGFHFAPAWVSISHLIPTQYVIFDTPVKECPTQDNVMVTIDIALIFRIQVEKEAALYDFCYRLGPDKLDKMLRAFEEDAIRGMARRRKYTEIYDLMDATHDDQLEATKRELNNHFTKFGVEIMDISVTNVHLPKTFADTMQEETVWKNRNEYKQLELKYNLKQIEFKELEAKSKQKSSEEIEQFCAQQDKELAEMNKKLFAVKAETQKQIAEINETAKVDTIAVEAKSKLLVSQIESKKDVALAKIRGEGRALADSINIQTNVYVNQKRSEAQKLMAHNKSQCIDLESESESKAANLLKAKRQYIEDSQKIDSLVSLANNNKVCIAGNSKDNVLAQLLANNRGSNLLGVLQQ